MKYVFYLISALAISIAFIIIPRHYLLGTTYTLPCIKTNRIILRDDRQLTTPSTTYVVKSIIDLKSKKVILPKGITLVFRGGMITNGTLLCDETTFSGNISFHNCTLGGSINNAYLTPEMFGAKGDGQTDDSSALGFAINSTCNLMLNKVYRVTTPFEDPHSVFAYSIPSGKNISGCGKILMEATTALFFIHSSNNIHISNIILDFSRIGDCYSCFNSNHGIVIVNSSDITIDSITVISTKGDGVYIGSYNAPENHNNNIIIKDSSFSLFGRQGISVIEGAGIQISNCFFNNREQFQYGGVDIEPNNTYEACDVQIYGCSFVNCGINTHRDSKKLNRNNRIVIENNTIRKQMSLVGDVGSHYIGVSVQDAISAVVNNNDVEGFVGIACYNCDSCIINNNHINAIYRGTRSVAIDNLEVGNNTIRIDYNHDYSNDLQINNSIVKDIGFNVEVSSSDGCLVGNDILGNVWVRNSHSFSFVDNICRGEHGALLLYMNNPSGHSTKAVVTGNTFEATGSKIYPISVVKGSLPIEFEISENRIKKQNQGIKYPNQQLNAKVINNLVYE